MFKILCTGCHKRIDAEDMWLHRKTCEAYLKIMGDPKKEEANERPRI